LVWALISLVIMNSKLYSLPIHQVLTFLYRCQICDPRQRAAFAAGLLPEVWQGLLWPGGWPCRPRWRASHVYHVLYLFWPLLYALSQWIKLFPVLVEPCIWSLKINTKRFRSFQTGNHPRIVYLLLHNENEVITPTLKVIFNIAGSVSHRNSLLDAGVVSSLNILNGRWNLTSGTWTILTLYEWS
jgi:hypothetical protein